MDTQDDSIDIARLQRVALGLESIPPTQPFSNEPETIENTPPNPSDHITTNSQPDDCVPAFAPKEAPHNSSVNEQPGRGEEERNATGLLLDPNRRRSLELAKRCSSASALRPSTMTPADTLPSDTQVISQSVYDEIIRQNKEAGNNGAESNLGDRATLMTLHEGDSGHIDLLSGFDGTNGHVGHTDENDDQSSSKLGDSSPLVYEPNLFPESQRFLAKTPATTVKRSHANGLDTVSPLTSRNPLAPDLESGSGIMALSQVFKATQAPSSPLVNGLYSDLMSDRPSPNIPIQNRPMVPSLSSPFNTLAATFPRDPSETQLNYVTMKESQANRDNIHGERMTRSADYIYSEDQSDGEFGKEPSFIERMRRQKRIDEEATAQFAAFAAPARPSIRRGRDMDNDEDLVRRGANLQEGDPHEPMSELPLGGTSEEETEQEEGSPEPVLRSQVPNSSTEEDKENCNDISVISLSHAASAHDRLSQALSLHDSPLLNSRESAQVFSSTHSNSRSRNLEDEPLDDLQSSPITVVKDSQRSPRQIHQANEDGEEAAGNSQAQQGMPQIQDNQSPDPRKSRLSPTKQVRIQSSPPESPHDQPSFNPHSNDLASRARSDSASPSKQEVSVIQSSNPGAGSGAENDDRAPMLDYRSKSSSMPSRIAETPVHLCPSGYKDVVPATTIPETSPNRFNNQGWMSDVNNEAADQEDDDLPPLYPRAHERATQSQPVISDSSSPSKPLLNSKILSSPSGRQRRALTEIAADASPHFGLSTFDVDINILSAEDREFRSAVAMSPIQPRKKRRGNNGQHIYASDPILPATPRSATYLAPLQEVDETAMIEPSRPTEPANKAEPGFLRRSKPPRRSESIWDVEDSPKFRASSKERSKLFARSLARERRPTQAQIPEEKETAQPGVVETPQQATPIPEVPSSEPIAADSPVGKEQQPPIESARIAPNQVLAPWSGQKRAYYPATCFGVPFAASQSRYLVKFEDSAAVEVPIGAVKRLEFRIGDAVKVDMPNVPKVTHIIRGFADKLSEDDISREVSKGIIPMTDVFGYSTLILGPKQRKSLPSGGLAVPENVINVPLSRIYLDTILWNQLKDRVFTYNSEPGDSESRLQTPSDRHSTPTSPGTRLSRSFRYSNGLFSGMVFAVSYGDNNDAKSRTTKMILENDGRILEDGFNELFDLPSNAPVVTPTKSTGPRPPGANVSFRLKSSVEDAGFACLIADKHSRRPKYMQALALNLPCLSDRWIEDCVAKGQILDWEMYLLPAGESSYLHGATKSRILTCYSAAKARLSETIAARPNLLSGQSVLLVTGRNGRADEERRKAYIFLTYALGASKIERVPDIQSARDVLLSQQQPGDDHSSWGWVYVDDDDRALAKAVALGTSTASFPSRKRRKSKLMESVSGDDLGLNSNIRIVGNEFVCQSLILGRLVD